MVSVLVAIYNAQTYLERCLSSLARQTLHNIEVLCVDDCSTDGSMSILREYEQHDTRFHVFQTERNSGQAVARNVALSHATGDIIVFTDADDWLADDALELIARGMEDGVDAVLFDVKMVDGDHVADYDMPPFGRISGIEAARRSIAWDGIHGVYGIRSAIHHQYPYDTTCRVYSDDITSTLHLLHSRTVATSSARYYYWQHQHSATHQVTARRFDVLRAKEQLAKRLYEEAVPADFHARAAEQIWRWLIDCCLYEYEHGKELTNEELAYGLAEIKRVWQTADLRQVDKRLTRKFGYMHTPWWWTFRVQNWTYFTLRRMLLHR